ncbi:3-ketoacyl-ACP reductase [Marinobacter psychrophilus]|jgi:3-oxoacyl-[acyl-carrier protein] reductase|uniref:3-ketoacyl-ACP reductase n=1 Tax=Marinobacter psychrophilus TaxID=330734 RepID=A0A0H4HYR6_9GAMM|nr:3-oxoacyl-ACP reductase [Marinobacter psychrophilus]AKO51856.1 3-ketoacyl-ACP reductase [Marinobacter psychrophilus]
MSDLYFKLMNTSLGQTAANTLGLPAPVPLQRLKRVDQPFIEGDVLLGAAVGGKLISEVGRVLGASAAKLYHASGDKRLVDSARAENRSKPKVLPLSKPGHFSALVFDASGIKTPEELSAMYQFFHSSLKGLAQHGRVLVLGEPVKNCRKPAHAAAQQALEGFIRSVAKEIGNKGATANLLRVATGAQNNLNSSLRFFLSAKSAYVSGQIAQIDKSTEAALTNPVAPLTGKLALVTGAARGIGLAIAQTLSRDGATVIGVDLPAARQELHQQMQSLKGHALALDITEADTPQVIATFIEQLGGLDLLIHNAGLTLDKTLGNMPEQSWNAAISVNLTAAMAITERIQRHELLHANGRIVCLSSVSGIAGNRGQSNYAAAKSGLIGYVQAEARQLKNGTTINAVAPGFIETNMTDAMPIAVREAGRRINSLLQGGQPVDVAETVSWLCSPGSGGLNGNVVRVCGQSLLGA